jgi:hypothetical protein
VPELGTLSVSEPANPAMIRVTRPRYPASASSSRLARTRTHPHPHPHPPARHSLARADSAPIGPVLQARGCCLATLDRSMRVVHADALLPQPARARQPLPRAGSSTIGPVLQSDGCCFLTRDRSMRVLHADARGCTRMRGGCGGCGGVRMRGAEHPTPTSTPPHLTQPHPNPTQPRPTPQCWAGSIPPVALTS